MPAQKRSPHPWTRHRRGRKDAGAGLQLLRTPWGPVFENGDRNGLLPSRDDLVDTVARGLADHRGRGCERSLVGVSRRLIVVGYMFDAVQRAFTQPGRPAVNGAEIRPVSLGPLGVRAKSVGGCRIGPNVSCDHPHAEYLLRQHVLREYTETSLTLPALGQRYLDRGANGCIAD